MRGPAAPLRRLAAALLAALACSSSCWSPKQDERSPIPSLESDYLSALYEFQPTLAARQGLRQYEGRMGSQTQIAILRRIDELKAQLGRVVAVRRKDLPPEDAARARLIDYRIRSELLDLELIGRWRYDPVYYLAIPYESIGYLRIGEYERPADRLRAITAALFEIGAVVSAMRTNLRDVPEEDRNKGLEIGHQLQAMLGELKSWGPVAAGIDVALQNRFASALDTARSDVDDSVRWLEQEVKPVPDSQAALGAEKFVMKVLFDEMLAIPLPEMVALGERLLAEDSAACVDQARLLVPDRRPEDVIREVVAASVVGPNPADELRRAVDAARSQMEAQNIVPLPGTVRVRVALIPPYLAQPDERFWMLLPPTQMSENEEQARNAPPEGVLLFAPPGDVGYPHWNAAELELAAMEDAFPGRMAQAVYRLRADGVRRVLSCHSATAGWAAYITDRILERSGVADPELRIHRLQQRLVADCRLLASVRIHTAGMSLDDAQRLFMDRAFLSPGEARLEARRALAEPTYFTGLLGRVEIERLRDDYQASQGVSFHLGDFHQKYLSLGAVPIPIARATLVP